MIALLGIALGIGLLIGGAALLVRGASEIASGFGVSPMVVGLTIVGFGTSSPELVVNLVGVSQGETALAFGNVIGSNISNLGLVLGVAAMFGPIAIHGEIVRREVPLLLLATTVMAVMALDAPLEGGMAAIGRIDAIVLMLMFCIFVYVIVLDLRRVRRQDPILSRITRSPIIFTPEKGRFCWLLVGLGFVLLFAGGEITTRSGVAFAHQMGLSTTVVGLFVVAVGTSMPELVTSIVATMRRETDLALGNIIGSNIFNSLVVLPASGIIAQIPVPKGGIGDLAVSWLLAAALIPIFLFGKAYLGRISGFILLLAYVGYATTRLLGS